MRGFFSRKASEPPAQSLENRAYLEPPESRSNPKSRPTEEAEQSSSRRSRGYAGARTQLKTESFIRDNREDTTLGPSYAVRDAEESATRRYPPSSLRGSYDDFQPRLSEEQTEAESPYETFLPDGLPRTMSSVSQYNQPRLTAAALSQRDLSMKSYGLSRSPSSMSIASVATEVIADPQKAAAAMQARIQKYGRDKKQLHVRVIGGQRFFENSNPSPQDIGIADMVLHLQFMRQRFKSRPHVCAVNPRFEELFVIILPSESELAKEKDRASGTAAQQSNLVPNGLEPSRGALAAGPPQKKVGIAAPGFAGRRDGSATLRGSKTESPMMIPNMAAMTPRVSSLGGSSTSVGGGAVAGSSKAWMEAVLQCSAPVNIVVTLQAPDGRVSLVGTHVLEWRPVLKSGLVKVQLELTSPDSSPAGSLDLSLELFPKITDGLSQQEIETKIAADKHRQDTADREFALLARQWWKAYLAKNESHRTRLCKIFAHCEDGEKRGVCSFVRPLKSGRLLDTPLHAARFVCLIRTDRDDDSNPEEVWSTHHTFLCKQRGDCEDHAVLLCSLLLGFGLDAYVCVGTNDSTGHVWVMTRASRTGPVVFWESTTGARYTHTPGGEGDAEHNYQTVGCVFNHCSFYANVQPSDQVHACSFELENPSLWMSMPREHIHPISRPSEVSLLPPNTSVFNTEDLIEGKLRHLIDKHRAQRKLEVPRWDDDLSYVLMTALTSYELERLSASKVTSYSDLFEQSMKLSNPPGYVFKGVPVEFSHVSPIRMMAALSRLCPDVLSIKGAVTYGLRIKIFPYPDNVNAVWCMLAVRYRPS